MLILIRISFYFPPFVSRFDCIFLTFNFVVADGIFVGWLGGGILGVRVWDWALLFLLGADTVLRYGQSLQLDVEHHWGICEWMWPGRPVN